MNTISQTTLPLPRKFTVEDAASVPIKATEVQRDPSAMSVELPSNFFFYDFKELAVKPLKGYHQAKFSRSAKEKSHKHMVEAISTVLTDGISAYDLTIPDFYWVLYYLRLSCYTKSPMIHRTVCTNPEHVLDVAAGRKTKDSLITLSTITKTMLQDITFNPEKEFEGFDQTAADAFFEKHGLKLHPVLVRDMVEMGTLYSDDGDEGEDSEMEYCAEFAGLLKSPDKHLTLADRISIVKTLDIDEIELIKDYSRRVSAYGVKETIKAHCGDCSAEVNTVVSISAHSFL
jgi:hypothetical protein